MVNHKQVATTTKTTTASVTVIGGSSGSVSCSLNSPGRMAATHVSGNTTIPSNAVCESMLGPGLHSQKTNKAKSDSAAKPAHNNISDLDEIPAPSNNSNALPADLEPMAMPDPPNNNDESPEVRPGAYAETPGANLQRLDQLRFSLIGVEPVYDSNNVNSHEDVIEDFNHHKNEDDCAVPGSDNMPISAKLSINETESKMFERIKNIVLEEQSKRSNSATTAINHSSTPIHLAEATIIQEEEGGQQENTRVGIEEELVAQPRERKWKCIFGGMILVLCLMAIVGALIGVVVGHTDTSNPNSSSSNKAGEDGEEDLEDNNSSSQPLPPSPPQSPPPSTISNANTMTMASQCVLLNYPQIAVFDQSEKDSDVILSIEGPVPNTRCHEWVPLMQKSIYCHQPQKQGSAVTNLVAQSQLWWYYQHKKEEGDDDDDDMIISLVHAGCVKADICEGDFTNGMANILLPYDNWMVVLKDLDGAKIISILEEALDILWVDFQDGLNRGGGYPYLGGLRFNANMTAPYPSRLSNVQVKKSPKNNKSHVRSRGIMATNSSSNIPDENYDEDGLWVPLDLTTNYTLITNNFLVDGGDGYSILSQAYSHRGDGVGGNSGRGHNLGVLVRDSFIEYSQEHILHNPPLQDYSTQNYIHDPIMF